MNVSTIPFLAILAPITLFFQQTRTFLMKIIRVFIKKRNIPYDLTLIFYRRLAEKSLVFNLDDYVINPIQYFSVKYDHSLPILIKLYNLEIFLYKKFIPIFITGNSRESIDVNYLKYTFNFEKFVVSLLEEKNSQWIADSNYDRFEVVERHGESLKKWRGTNGGIIPHPTASSSENSSKQNYPILRPYMIIQGKMQNKILGHDVNDIRLSAPSAQSSYQFTKQGVYVLNQVQKWLQHEKWYQQRNIPWKRGICLYGRPGNGKSSLVLEIARKLQIPLYSFDLSSYDNTEFAATIKNDLTMLSGIVLFEDLDTTFDGRKNIAFNSSDCPSLTFDYFLNKLSGANPIKNKFIFITTNHVEKLDEALLRPGRMDEVIEILPLENEEKYKVAANIVGNHPEKIEELIQNSDGDSTAQFEKKCVDIALSNLWE